MIAFARLPLLIDIDNAVPKTPSAPPLLGLALLLGGCGPSVSYSYIPPTSDAGLHCVSQCNAEKRQCKDLTAAQHRSEALYQAQSTAYNYMQNSDKKKLQVLPLPAAQLRFRRRLPGRVLPVLRRHHPPHHPPGLGATSGGIRTCGNTVRRGRSTCAPSPLPPRYHGRPGSMTNTSPALRCTGLAFGVMMQQPSSGRTPRS